MAPLQDRRVGRLVGVEVGSGVAQRLRGAAAARPRRAAFAGVFAASLTCFLAVGAVLPVLPGYVKGPVGAGDVAVGVVVGAFAFTAVIGRPIGGRWADAVGRRRVVVVGLVLCGVAGLLYLLPGGVATLVLARLVLGIGDGWVFTAGLSWAVDLAPEDRRGQVISIFGLSVWGGLAVGPLVGDAVLRAASYDAVFLLSAALPVLGAVLAMRVPDAHAPPEVRAPRGPLVPREVVAPGLALSLGNIGYGTLAGFIVLLLAERDAGSGATAFTAMAVAVVGSRLLLSWLPDRLGAARSAALAGVAETAGLVVLATASGPLHAYAGAVLVGTGFSLLFPSLALLVVSRVGEERRGAALGTFTAFFDVGVGIGAPLAGAISAVAGYEAAFLTAAGLAMAGVLVGLVSARPRSRSPG